MITYAVENWADVKGEARDLWPLHWVEVGQNRERMVLDPDIARLDDLAARGMLHIVIARAAGKMVGYHASMVDTLVHYRRILAAKGDLYWLHPDYRLGLTGVRLFQEVERTLRQRGVQVIYDTTKVYQDNGALFEHLGYAPIERLYSKWIGK